MEDAGEVYTYNIVGKPVYNTARQVVAGYFRMSPDYFRTTGIKLRRGRYFDSTDVGNSPRVAIVNEAFVKREFPDKDPIGERINLLSDVNTSVGNERSGSTVEIVGVVASTRESTFYLEVPPIIYVPVHQDQPRTMSLLIKTAGDPTTILPEVRARILSLDPEQPVYNIRTVDQIIGTTHSLFRFNTLLLTAFAAISLILSLIGIYGVIAYTVSQRTREFGIRLALGCRRGDIFRLVLGKGVLLSVIGLGIGLAASFPAIKFMARSMKESMNLDLISNGPMLFVAVSGAMTVVVLLACFIPARRATKVDPMVALRYE
jgi:putative ABC transport system permease protein